GDRRRPDDRGALAAGGAGETGPRSGRGPARPARAGTAARPGRTAVDRRRGDARGRRSGADGVRATRRAAPAAGGRDVRRGQLPPVPRAAARAVSVVRAGWIPPSRPLVTH